MRTAPDVSEPLGWPLSLAIVSALLAARSVWFFVADEPADRFTAIHLGAIAYTIVLGIHIIGQLSSLLFKLLVTVFLLGSVLTFVAGTGLLEVPHWVFAALYTAVALGSVAFLLLSRLKVQNS